VLNGFNWPSGPFKRGNEPSGSIKGGEFLLFEWLLASQGLC
jgi:hypothetical protein